MSEKEFDLKTMKLEDFNLSENLDVFVMILNDNKKINDLKILGKSSREWIKNAVKDFKYKEYDYNGEDIVSFIKSNVFNKKIVVVLYSNMPLLTQNTINSYIDYFKIKNLCALKMPKGYIFDFDYLISVEKVYNPQLFNFSEEDFLSLNSLSDLNKIYNILRHRIINFHVNNGVIIYDENSVTIEAEANINSGVIIYPNNLILGETLIASGTILKSNNTIENSIIKDNCEIENSIVKNSLVEENSKILDYSVIKNNVKVKKDSVLINKTIIGEN